MPNVITTLLILNIIFLLRETYYIKRLSFTADSWRPAIRLGHFAILSGFAICLPAVYAMLADKLLASAVILALTLIRSIVSVHEIVNYCYQQHIAYEVGYSDIPMVNPETLNLPLFIIESSFDEYLQATGWKKN